MEISSSDPFVLRTGESGGTPSVFLVGRCRNSASELFFLCFLGDSFLVDDDDDAIDASSVLACSAHQDPYQHISTMVERSILILAGQPTPPKRTPPAVIRLYYDQGLLTGCPMFSLIRPAIEALISQGTVRWR